MVLELRCRTLDQIFFGGGIQGFSLRGTPGYLLSSRWDWLGGGEDEQDRGEAFIRTAKNFAFDLIFLAAKRLKIPQKLEGLNVFELRKLLLSLNVSFLRSFGASLRPETSCSSLA